MLNNIEEVGKPVVIAGDETPYRDVDSSDEGP